MVVLNRIYTRSGDDGTTALGTGERRKKYDLRIEAYGTLDEVNAVIGVARLHVTDDPSLDTVLARIQNDLFDVEADLCMPSDAGKGPGGARLTVSEAQVTWLEGEIDRLNAELAPLKSFILPGGGRIHGFLHQARTVCRRAERELLALSRVEPIGEWPLRYLNRLGDAFFVLGRWVGKHLGEQEYLWERGLSSHARARKPRS